MRMQRAVVLVGLLSLAGVTAASAQPNSPNTTPGAVARVIHVKINPGHGAQFWQDLRQNLKPIYDTYKAQGIITDWLVSTKTTTESPDDWGVSIQLIYPNFAALDNLNSKTDPITLAHYGTAEKRAAAASARSQTATTVHNYLVRRQAVNPWR